MENRTKCGFNQSKISKFFCPWEGPYVVLEITAEANYRVAKPSQMAKWRIILYNMLKPCLEDSDASSPREEKKTKALRSEGFLEDPGVDKDEWEEEEPDVRPTQQHVRIQRIVQRRRLNEQVDDNVLNLEELFREQAVREPDRITAEVPPDDNRPQAPVAADEAPAKQPLHEPELLALDQPTGVPEPREVTEFSPDTGPARQPRQEIQPVIWLGLNE